jgi:hypothetical protein
MFESIMHSFRKGFEEEIALGKQIIQFDVSWFEPGENISFFLPAKPFKCSTNRPEKDLMDQDVCQPCFIGVNKSNARFTIVVNISRQKPIRSMCTAG